MPPLWWSVWVALVLGGFLWAYHLVTEPSHLEPSPAVAGAEMALLPTHWLVPDGVYAMTLRLTSDTLDTSPTQQRVILISRMTSDFQGIMAIVPEGPRWLRRGQEVYRLLPDSKAPDLIEANTTKEVSFIDTAFSVSDFFFGFGSGKLNLDPSGQGRVVVQVDPTSHTPYHRLDVETNEKGCPVSLVAYDESGMALRTLTVLSYVDVPHLCWPQHVVVENSLKKLSTDVVVEKWSVQAFPPFVFTPQTLKSFTIEE